MVIFKCKIFSDTLAIKESNYYLREIGHELTKSPDNKIIGTLNNEFMNSKRKMYEKADNFNFPNCYISAMVMCFKTGKNGEQNDGFYNLT
jgi:hypothetical protein